MTSSNSSTAPPSLAVALTPSDRYALERTFPALRLTHSSILARRIARVLLFVLILSLIAMFAAPWQQTAAGKGQVVAFDSNQRHQDVDAPISGRIVNWQPTLIEGAMVKEGERLFDIEVIDTDIRTQMGLQLAATQRKLEADRTIVNAYFENVQAFKDVKEQVILAGGEFIKVAEQKFKAEEEGLKGALAAAEQSEKDRVRRKELLDQKVGSQFDWERAVRQADEANAKVEQARSYVKAAANELVGKKAELVAKTREAQAKIDSSTAVYEKSKGDFAATEKEIADINAKLTMQKQPVLAPQDGYIFKLKVSQGGQIVSQGSSLLELVPSSPDRAVAIKVDGNDAPLVSSKDSAGRPRKVRLQFEGWPAVQFSGWPSAAVGTFGGIVSVVDSTDDGQGKFRVLILPDPDEAPWPNEMILRQGVRANGWVLLNEVPLGWEVWRQMNGFPPVVAMDEPKKDGEKLLRGKK
ncbi:MAG: HlyD family efflux transporter periplasmic adaptor subunit [Planctomycetales bacterium]|nr:HlyD family efflux transporter periplasmic adaptor subunit [Planctomycetales bacterium]